MKKTRNFAFILALVLSILPTITHATSTDCGGGKILWISEGYYGYPDFSFKIEESPGLPPPPPYTSQFFDTTQYGRTQNLLDGRSAIIGAYFGNKFVRIYNPYQADCLGFAEVDVVVCNTEADCLNFTQ